MGRQMRRRAEGSGKMADELREKNIDESDQMSEDARKAYYGSDVMYGFNGIQNLIDTGYKGAPSTATNNVPSTVTNNAPSTATNAVAGENSVDSGGVGGTTEEDRRANKVRETVTSDINIRGQSNSRLPPERNLVDHYSGSATAPAAQESDEIRKKRLELDAGLRMKGMEAALELWKKQRDDRQALRDRELAFDEWNAKNQIAEKKALLNKLSGTYSMSWSGRATLTNGRFTHDWSGTAFNRYQTLIDQLNKGGLTAKNPYSEAAVSSDDSLDMPDWLSELVSSTERKSAQELKRGSGDIKMSVREPQQPKPQQSKRPKYIMVPKYNLNWGSAAYGRKSKVVVAMDPSINPQAAGNDPLFTARMERRFGHVEPSSYTPQLEVYNYGQDNGSSPRDYKRPRFAINKYVPVREPNNRGPQLDVGGPAYRTTADEFIGYRQKLLARQRKYKEEVKEKDKKKAKK